ncbi:hypothetical protein LCGC14_0408630 [marine sediment metagenome]|uniref:Uncharacterized protein n=1 Tax=marine sediment metagenome TaxID=412755 RepID=A0A0F9VGH7_9ZZZZ
MAQSIDTITLEDVDGCKLIESSTHIGLFNFSLAHDNKLKHRMRRLLKTVVVSKHPLSKTRLLLIRTGRLGVQLYNYSPQFSFYKSKFIYGIHVLLVRLTWNRF